MEVKELGHIVLYVRDIERSSRFYRDVLGWRQVLPEPGQPSQLPMAMFSAPSGRTHHELLLIEVGPDAAAQPEGKRVGLYHFGLKVGDSDDELREARPRRQRDRAVRRRPRRRLAQQPHPDRRPHQTPAPVVPTGLDWLFS